MRHELVRKRFFEGLPRYRWLATLGSGAVGIVFKALDLELDDTVAIKVLSPDVERDDQQLLGRFKRELSLNRKIKHPNVARMYDFGISDDFPYITMEYIPGKDLWTLIDERHRLPPAEAVSILRQIARGADAIHRLGIVHRDLKSENVIVDEHGAAAILDFGLARGVLNSNMTMDAVLIGTPHYMAPEQAMAGEVGPRSDVYSIGIIAFEALTGCLPFTGPTPIAVAMKQVSEPVPDLLSGLPEVSPKLRAVVMKALEKDPAKRFASAAELEAELAMFQPTPVSTPADDGDTVARQVEAALDSIVIPGRTALLARTKIRPGQRSTLPVPRVTPSLADARKPLVLVANDDVRELLKLATAACEAGCRTEEVRGGQEALEALMRRGADVLILDVELPDMDGFDVARVLKSRPRFAELPILLTTSRTDRSELAHAMQCGATDLLSKPVVPQALTARLFQLLPRLGFEATAVTMPGERLPRVRTRSRR